MVDFRPLIIVTGTVHAEGGLKSAVRTQAVRDGDRAIVTEDRTVSSDRRAANVVATNYMRKLRGLGILRTPWGVLIGPENTRRVRDLLAQATIDAMNFNKAHAGCKLTNTMLVERLAGARLDAVRGYVIRKAKEDDDEVKAAIPSLTTVPTLAAS